MNNKFEVKFEKEFWVDYYDQQQIRLIDVIPQPICLNCPHCQVYSIMNVDSKVERFEKDIENGISFQDKNLLFDFICSCLQCNKTVFVQAQAHGNAVYPGYQATDEPLQEVSSGKILSIYPYRENITVPSEVPDEYASDFRESVLVMPLSSTASVVLSRRILQSIIKKEFNIDKYQLGDAVKEFKKIPGIPSEITDTIDNIREIGNFAAHPNTDNTGKVLPVEPDEAKWLIELLERLFDFKFIAPKRNKERENKLKAKLKAPNKPSTK